jgi:hypothetical protein
MLRLVAKYADAYHTDQPVSVANATAVVGLFQVVDEACRAIGRDPATLMRTSGCTVAVEGAGEIPGGVPEVSLHGSTEQIVESLAGFASVGVKHFICWLMPLTMKGIERLAPVVEAAHKL